MVSKQDGFTTGILRDKTKDDKLMYNLINDRQNYSFCKLNYWLKSLDTTEIK